MSEICLTYDKRYDRLKFNNQKGYGFISDENGNDVFVHYSGLDMEGYKTLEEGQAVEFDVVDGNKGSQAVHVKRV